MTAQDAIHALWTASIATPIDLKTNGARDIAVALKLSLAGIFFNEVDGGGHFAAWEQPELFSTGIRAAFRSLR